MKKVLLLPMMLMGVALSFTSCGDNDDPGKDPDVVTYDFKNLPADSGAKPTEDQMSAVVATFVDEVALPTYKDMLTKMTAYKNAVDKFIASGSKNDLADACDAWRAVVYLGNKVRHSCSVWRIWHSSTRAWIAGLWIRTV